MKHLKNLLYFFLINKKKISRSIILTCFFFIFLFLLDLSNILHKYLVPPFKINGEIVFFGDAWRVAKWIECSYENINILKVNNCSDQPLTYGLILTYLPHNFVLKFVYTYAIPILSILLIVFFHFHLNKTKSFIDFVLVGLALVNQHTLLMFDRGNTDLLIYILILFACFNIEKYQFIKSFLISFLTLIKYYPLLIFQIFLINFSKKKINILLIFSILIFFFIFIHYDEILYIFKNHVYSASLRYNYSFFANKKYFSELYNFNNLGFILTSLIIFFSVFISYKAINWNSIKKINFIYYNERIFVISLNIIFATYFLFENYYYKDFYFMLLIPLILEEKFGRIFNKLLIYLIIFRYLYILISNNFIIWRKNYELLLIQNFLDNILIGILFPIFLYLNFKIFIKIKKNLFI